MDDADQQSAKQRSKWRGRVEVMLLVAGGLILLVPTLAVFLAGAD